MLGEGRYRIDEFLGDNDIVTTYGGYDTFRNKRVTLYELFPKTIAERGAGEDQRISLKLMSNEALFRNMRRHMISRARKLIGLYPLENAGNILAFFEENGTVYVVEERSGETVTLSQYLQKRHSAKFTVEDLLKILGPVFTLLEKLHEKGIWHGTITPENILITEGRQPLLTHLTDPAEDIAAETLGNIAIRDMAYAPVELFVEEAGRGPRADIFAMGAIFYRYTTGETLLPYYERINDRKEPEQPKIMKTRIMDSQSDAIVKATALYEFDRFGSLQELLAGLAPDDIDLESLHSQQEEAVHITKLPFWYKKQQNEYRRYVVVVSAAAILLLVIFVPRLVSLGKDGKVNRFYKRFNEAGEYEKCLMLSELTPSERGVYANDYVSLPDELDDEHRSEIMEAKVYDFQLGHYVKAGSVNTKRSKYEYIRIDYVLNQAWITYQSDEKTEHTEIELKPAIDGSFTVRTTETDKEGKTRSRTEKVGAKKAKE